jgi:hypothetical protein
VVVERTSVNTLFDVDQSLATSVQIRLVRGMLFIYLTLFVCKFVFFVHFLLLICFWCSGSCVG